MEYVIEVKNGEPVGYPMSLENLRYIHKDISADSLPEGLEPFVHVSAPQLGPYEVLVEATGYARVNGVIQDTFVVRPMTQEEKDAQIARGLAAKHPDGYTFDYDKCRWMPDLNKPGSVPNVIG